ncbi:hypothetical protein [Lentzea sp. E54]|uniref:hypothetical protein n=1 Tax=Lentzea xerophila TaxID=3435883 RepID=UPI003DA4B207
MVTSERDVIDTSGLRSIADPFGTDLLDRCVRVPGLHRLLEYFNDLRTAYLACIDYHDDVLMHERRQVLAEVTAVTIALASFQRVSLPLSASVQAVDELASRINDAVLARDLVDPALAEDLHTHVEEAKKLLSGIAAAPASVGAVRQLEAIDQQVGAFAQYYQYHLASDQGARTQTTGWALQTWTADWPGLDLRLTEARRTIRVLLEEAKNWYTSYFDFTTRMEEGELPAATGLPADAVGDTSGVPALTTYRQNLLSWRRQSGYCLTTMSDVLEQAHVLWEEDARTRRDSVRQTRQFLSASRDSRKHLLSFLQRLTVRPHYYIGLDEAGAHLSVIEDALTDLDTIPALDTATKTHFKQFFATAKTVLSMIFEAQSRDLSSEFTSTDAAVKSGKVIVETATAAVHAHGSFVQKVERILNHVEADQASSVDFVTDVRQRMESLTEAGTIMIGWS